MTAGCDSGFNQAGNVIANKPVKLLDRTKCAASSSAQYSFLFSARVFTLDHGYRQH
jgi:hypothetical protein